MQRFAESLKSDSAFFFDRGASALYALLKSMGVKQGDEVICQSFTCTSVPNPIIRTGATPVYVDIDPQTLNLDPNKVEARKTPKTKAIIAQHTFGVPAEMDAILDIARRNNLWVVEDACHALGSRFKGQEVSTLGDAAIHSFGWHKPITLGAWGAAIVNNPELKPKMEEYHQGLANIPFRDISEMYLHYFAYALLYTPSRFWTMKEIYRRIRDFSSGPRKGSLEALIFGQSSKASAMSNAELQDLYKSNIDAVRPPNSAPEREVKNVQVQEAAQSPRPMGKKMPKFEQRRLFGKLNHWDEMVKHQRWIVTRYRSLLSQVGYSPLEPDSRFEPVYYKYPLLIDPVRKKRIFEIAGKSGVEMSDMFGSPIYPVERAAQWKALGYEKGMCPISEDVSARIVALPVHKRVKASQIDKIVSLLSSLADEEH